MSLVKIEITKSDLNNQYSWFLRSSQGTILAHSSNSYLQKSGLIKSLKKMLSKIEMGDYKIYDENVD